MIRNYFFNNGPSFFFEEARSLKVLTPRRVFCCPYFSKTVIKLFQTKTFPKYSINVALKRKILLSGINVLKTCSNPGLENLFKTRPCFLSLLQVDRVTLPMFKFLDQLLTSGHMVNTYQHYIYSGTLLATLLERARVCASAFLSTNYIVTI